jgi:hypothetical protein
MLIRLISVICAVFQYLVLAATPSVRRRSGSFWICCVRGLRSHDCIAMHCSDMATQIFRPLESLAAVQAPTVTRFMLSLDIPIQITRAVKPLLTILVVAEESVCFLLATLPLNGRDARPKASHWHVSIATQRFSISCSKQCSLRLPIARSRPGKLLPAVPCTARKLTLSSMAMVTNSLSAA